MIATGKPQIYNESTEEYEEVLIETDASQVFFRDGLTMQEKLDNGDLKGKDGRNGADGAKGADGSAFVVEANYSQNGYVKYADGTMRCWGTVGAPTQAGTVTVHYPKAFSRIFYANVASAYCSSSFGAMHVFNIGTSYFQFKPWMPDVSGAGSLGSLSTNWEAFGMWK